MSDIWFPWKHTRARKEHECTTCSRRIDPGETYIRGSGVWMGQMIDWKQCAHCEAMLSFLDYDDTFCEDDFREFDPFDIPTLRMKVHFNMKWRNKKGELFPIPEK